MSTQHFRLRKPVRTTSQPIPQKSLEQPEDFVTDGVEDPGRFQFVGGPSGNEGDSLLRRRMRQHVMRDYVEQKRALGVWIDSRLHSQQSPGIRSQPQVKQQRSEGLQLQPPLAWVPRVVEPGDFPVSTPPQYIPQTSQLRSMPPRALGSPSIHAVDFASNPASDSHSLELIRNDSFKPPTGTPTDFTRLIPEGTSIQTFLGAARIDPFDTLAIECGAIEYQILGFYAYAMGQIISGMGPRAPFCHFRVSLNYSLEDTAIMHLVFAYASYRWATLCGGSPIHENTALAHKIKGINIVNERIGDPQRGPEDFNIQAALIMMGIEGRDGNMHGFKSHLRGVRSVVSMRRGLSALNKILVWQLCSTELRMMYTAGVEHMPYHDKAFSSFLQAQSNLGLPPSGTPPHFFDPAGLPLQLYLHACSLEFVLMLSSFRTLSTARNSFRYLSLESMASLAYPSAECFSVASAFRSNSPLYTMLQPSRLLPNINRNAAAAHVYQPDTVRLACLFYIHVTIWSYRNEPFRTDAYMSHINSQTIQNNLDRSGNVEGLSWVLIRVCLSERDEEYDARMERTRLILRLMRVARKLGYESRRHVENKMFDALVGVKLVANTGSEGNRLDEQEWIESGTVWEEVFGDGRERGFVVGEDSVPRVGR